MRMSVLARTGKPCSAPPLLDPNTNKFQSTARPSGILLRERREYIRVGFCATSVSRKSRKKIPDVHALKVSRPQSRDDRHG
jgi:hypothetical protein